METRTGFLLGGAAVIAVSVSVVASVVATSAVALADAPGALIGAAPVRLAAADTSSRTSGSAGENAAVIETTSVATSPASPAELLPAPAPVVVAPSQTAAAAPPAAVEDEVLATGSWEPVHEWATAHGWTRADVDAWITRFRAHHGLTRDGAVSPHSVGRDAPTPQTPASTGLSDTVATTPGDGSKKNRSHGTPDPGD